MMAKQRSPVVLTEEQREEIAARREAELWGMAQRIGGPQALRELLPKLDEQAMSVHSVGFGDLAKEIGVVAAVAKLGFETQFIEAAKRNGLLGATARLGYGPGAKLRLCKKTDRLLLRAVTGAGADSTLLERAIRAAERRHMAEINKGKRRLQNLENIIAQSGSDANRANATEREYLVIAKYMASKKLEHNRASLIAEELQLSTETVRKILDRAGIKKRKTPKTTNSQGSA